MTRDTSTGTDYETEVFNLLVENYEVSRNVCIGKKRNGGRHYVDILLDGDTLISLKFQRVAGTAEEKIPFEIMKLQHAVLDHKFKHAMLVLAGDTGWKWKNYYLSDEFKDDMRLIYPDVSLYSHEQFMEIFDGI